MEGWVVVATRRRFTDEYKHLWDTWVSGIVRDRLAEEIGSDHAARTLVTFLAGIHDVGKASPAFAQLANQVGMGDLVSRMERAGLSSPTLPSCERERHTLTGHVATEEWLCRRWEYPAKRAAALASIVSAHHGVPAQDQARLCGVRTHTRAMGDQAWDRVRDEILDTMVDITGAAPVLDSLRATKLSLHALLDLSALVIVADWIASDSDRFPYDMTEVSADRLATAIETLDLREPWSPDMADAGTALFRGRFPHLASSDPSPLQLAAFDAARQAETAPMMLIEAPTGAGKSEAALLAAEVLAARFGAGGVYIGLPTMATSNAMFGRVLRWVQAWPGKHDPTMWLAHGKATLNDDFDAMLRSTRIRAVYDEDEQKQGTLRGHVRVSGWLMGRKRGLLANVVVGTIDQVLMGALQARHLMLRHLALSSKVVIVDEVHSADTYMRSYLVRMLEYFAGYGTPVILLSATLPPSHRKELIDAYHAGRLLRTQESASGLRPRRRPNPSQEPRTHPNEDGTGPSPGPQSYPLITVTTDSTRYVPVKHGARQREIMIAPLDDDLGHLVQYLRKTLADGGCVGVLRNTVGRAQSTYDALRAEFGDIVELYHSRFVAAARATRERALVERLGPPGSPRPERLIAVGTQVLEQSLDIDLDLLVTDLAPADLIIQRIGRLHRHPRPATDRPASLAVPRCLIAGVQDWAAPVPVPAAGSKRVYAHAHLLRSACVLRPYLNGEPLRLPQDGPVLVHAAYDPQLDPPAGWEDAWVPAHEKQDMIDDRSRSKATFGQTARPGTLTTLTGWTTTPVGDAREATGRAQVRDSEDGIEVILVQHGDDGRFRLPVGDFPGAGREIPIQPDDHDKVTRQLASCTVGLPMNLTNPGRWDETVSELELNGVADTWQQSSWLAGQLALAVDPAGQSHLNGHLVTYTPDRGLEVTPLNQEHPREATR